MVPATYNILETVVRALYQVADAALEKEKAGKLRHELGQQLTQARVAMQRDRAEDIVQDMAGVVVALSEFVLGRKPMVNAEHLRRKHLQIALHDLGQHYKERQKVTEVTLPPTGHRTCAGEDSWEWCKTHCARCGATLDGDGHCKNCDAPEQAPEAELQHGGELRPSEPIIEDTPLESIGLDQRCWSLITDNAGHPVAALFRNDSEEQYEQLRAAILSVVTGRGN